MTLLEARTSNPVKGGPSFSLRNRIMRSVWTVAWLLLASWTPPQMRAWRRVLLRLFGASVAPTANIYGSATIWLPANLEIGQHACVGPRVTVYNMAKITLHDYALVSQGAHLCAGTHDIEDDHFQLKTRPISIGSRAWVATEAFVGPGVSVGAGAVLGARACAFRDLEPWTVYLGNPAQILRKRNSRPAPAASNAQLDPDPRGAS
jgi:putative colanic acid biosynthesis acetyltransferase WcaF